MQKVSEELVPIEKMQLELTSTINGIPFCEPVAAATRSTLDSISVSFRLRGDGYSEELAGNLWLHVLKRFLHMKRRVRQTGKSFDVSVSMEYLLHRVDAALDPDDLDAHALKYLWVIHIRSRPESFEEAVTRTRELLYGALSDVLDKNHINVPRDVRENAAPPPKRADGQPIGVHKYPHTMRVDKGKNVKFTVPAPFSPNMTREQASRLGLTPATRD